MTVENKVYKKATSGSVDMEPETWLMKKTQILVTCQHGNCAHIIGRGDGKDWNISAEGKITPSLYWKGSCECHIFLQLEGWVPR